ncbi:MAG: hypothetical protein K1060chlam2_00057 [Chlamydiae bacterium]|nr:hypothetical protein [Chlamydiota bacterium]
MKIFLITLALALILIALSALFLGIGRLLKSKKPFNCKRCSKPEEDCSTCGKKKKEE